MVARILTNDVDDGTVNDFEYLILFPELDSSLAGP